MNLDNLSNLNEEIINQRLLSQMPDEDIQKIVNLIQIELKNQDIKQQQSNENMTSIEINKRIDMQVTLIEAAQILQDRGDIKFVDSLNNIDNFTNFANYLKFTQEGEIRNDLDEKIYQEHRKKFNDIIFKYNTHAEQFNFQSNGSSVDDSNKNVNENSSTKNNSNLNNNITLPTLESLKNSIPPEYLAKIINDFCNNVSLMEDINKFFTDLLSVTKNQTNTESNKNNIENVSSFILHADELFLRKYLEENLEKLIQVALNPQLDDAAFAKVVSLIDIEKEGKNNDGKYDEIFKKLNHKFASVIDGVNTQKKLISLKNEYHATNDENRKKELAKEISSIEVQKEVFKILSIKNPELIAKMLLNLEKDKMINTLKGMGARDMTLFLNALGEKNISSLNNILNKTKEQDKNLEANARFNLTDKNLKSLTEHKKTIGEDKKEESKSQNSGFGRSLEKDDKNKLKDKENQEKKPETNENNHNLTQTQAWNIMNAYNATRRQTEIDKFLPQSGGTGINGSILQGQMSIAELQKQGMLKGSIAEEIHKLQSQGVKIDNKKVDDIIGKIQNSYNQQHTNVAERQHNIENKNANTSLPNSKTQDIQKDSFFKPTSTQQTMEEYIAQHKEKERQQDLAKEQEYKNNLDAKFDGHQYDDIQINSDKKDKNEERKTTLTEQQLATLTANAIKGMGGLMRELTEDITNSIKNQVNGVYQAIEKTYNLATDEIISLTQRAVQMLSPNDIKAANFASTIQNHIENSQKNGQNPDEWIASFKSFHNKNHHFQDLVASQKEENKVGTILSR